MHRLAEAGHPVLTREISDPHELGNEFLQWEVATAAAGMLLGIDPFDQPNVAESKANTDRVLEEWERTGELPDPGSDPLDDVLARDRARRLRRHHGLRRSHRAERAALPARCAPPSATATRWRRRSGSARGSCTRPASCTRAGPQVGCFIQVVDPDPGDLPIPGKEFGFGTLIRAQAIGDLQALRGRGRPVARVTPDELESLAIGRR